MYPVFDRRADTRTIGETTNLLALKFKVTDSDRREVVVPAAHGGVMCSSRGSRDQVQV